MELSREVAFVVFFIAGFAAQMIHGSIGMGYGIAASSIMLLLGAPPALASASIQAAKIAANGASGFSHLGFGNVDRQLLRRLAIPGVIGGVGGALLLSFLPVDVSRPAVSAYLIVMGLMVLVNAFRMEHHPSDSLPLFPLSLVGGFFNSVGGGGWGPIVTSNLLASVAYNKRQAVGTSNMAHFAIVVAVTITFAGTTSMASNWPAVLGLIVGSLLAAPLSAYWVGRANTRALMILIGLMIIGFNLRTVIVSL